MKEQEQEIRAVIDAYVTGFNRGDRRHLLQALHARFVSTGFFGGELQWDSAEEFAEFCAQSAPDPDGPVPEWRLEALSVSGHTAVAVIEDNWGERAFKDSLTLLKDEGRWQIVFKVFHNLN